MTQANAQFAALSEQEIQTIENFYRAFGDKNPNLLDDVLTPDWKDAQPVPGLMDGPQGLKDQFPMLFSAFPDLKIVIHEIVGASGHAGVRASITGTHQGEMFGVAPSGQFLDIPIYEFHHLENGRITHTWHLEDWFGMLNKVGAWPPPAPAGA